MLCHAVTLTFDLLTLNVYSTSGVMRLNSVPNLSEIEENPALSYRRFSRFLPCNFRGGTRLINGSQGCVNPTLSNLVRTEGDHFYRRNLFQRSDILLHFQTRAAQIEWCWKRCQNLHFLTPLWKLGEGWARSLYQLLKLYLRPNLRNTFDGHVQLLSAADW